ncbi:MAG: hypothetical protein RBG13Loki_2750 [Promethearchaeota archaeon CR_4]|nr:MAG: hypothetical protein RBG13Loki_2750 [Candidatus Lokiarchaeota archaeon CR_4]
MDLFLEEDFSPTPRLFADPTFQQFHISRFLQVEEQKLPPNLENLI